MREKLELRPYQKRVVKEVIDHDHRGVFLPPGLGKTSIALCAIKELFEKGEIKNCLVIAPPAPMLFSWPAEIKKWDEFQGVYYEILKPPYNKRTKDEFVSNVPFIHLASSCNIQALEKLNVDFDMIVIDESHYIKNPQSARFKSLKKLMRTNQRRYIMTGTPMPKSYQDIWSQMYALDYGRRLGRSLTEFRSTYFDAVRHPAGFFTYDLKPGADKLINEKIKNACIYLDKKDYLTLPDMMFNKVPVILPDDIIRTLDELEHEFLIELEQTSITAPSAGVLSNKLRQMVNGSVYTDDGDVMILHREKAKALRDLTEDLGEPCLVAVGYRHEVDLIREVYGEKLPYFGGGISSREKNIIIEKWNRKRIPVLLIHPSAGGAGLNLQAGGNNIAWFSLPWSLSDYQQTNARLHRSGQKNHVTVHHIVAEKTIDTRVARVLSSKDKNQSDMLETIRRVY